MKPANPHRMALVMMVRDEAARIRTCLASVLDRVDTWCICDTGSVDGTMEIVKEFFHEAGLPGVVHEHPWKNFRHNRNRAIAEARDMADWLLVLDADMVLHGEPPGFLEEDHVEAVALRVNEQPVYYSARLLRGGLPWEYSGITHEVPCLPGRPHTLRKTDAWVIHHHPPPGTLRLKLERDIPELRAEAEQFPGHAPSWFHLGMAYCSLMTLDPDRQGEYARLAQDALRQRLLLHGDPEERYLAMYRLAMLRMYCNGFSWESFGLLLGAHAGRPHRLEALFEAVRYCRKMRHFHLGLQLAQPHLTTPLPESDLTFIDEAVYRHSLREEFAKCAYEAGELDTARSSLEILLDTPGLPPEVMSRARKNLNILNDSPTEKPIHEPTPPS